MVINTTEDGIGYVERLDFSAGNYSYESRVETVTKVASVCYGKTEAKNKIKLYDRLAVEGLGIPSSSYEFCPVLIEEETVISRYLNNIRKFGELIYIEANNTPYYISNLRALIKDVGENADMFFNKGIDTDIIRRNFTVFKIKTDIATARQFMRHRCSWQELSRRYTKQSAVPFEFYNEPSVTEILGKRGIESVNRRAVELYQELVKNNVKLENARRVLPLSLYTTINSAWLPSQLKNFIGLRTENNAQKEIRDIAFAMQKLKG